MISLLVFTYAGMFLLSQPAFFSLSGVVPVVPSVVAVVVSLGFVVLVLAIAHSLPFLI